MISILGYAITPPKALPFIAQQMDKIKIPLPHLRQIWNISKTKEVSFWPGTLTHEPQTYPTSLMTVHFANISPVYLLNFWAVTSLLRGKIQTRKGKTILTILGDS